MSNVFGKYTPYNTIIHRLDPRIKFFALIALMVMCFLPYGNYANRFIVLGILGLIIVAIMIIGKIFIKSQIISKTPLSSSFSPLLFRKSCVQYLSR